MTMSSSAMYLLNPFIDIIHGDVVLDDLCCRAVGHALITAHEAELKALATQQNLPSGLQRAIEAYCIRSYLIQSPQLLHESAVIVQALRKFAQALTTVPAAQKKRSLDGTDQLSEAPFSEEHDACAPHNLFASAGAAIAECLRALQQQQQQQQHRTVEQEQPQQDDIAVPHLRAALDDAILGYFIIAVQQCAQRAADCLAGSATWDLGAFASASYQTSLQRFVESAVVRRAARHRARAAAQEAEVQALLFGAAECDPAPQQQHSQPRTLNAADPAASISLPPLSTGASANEAAAVRFSKEVEAAMDDAIHTPRGMPAHHQAMLKHPIPSVARRQRVLRGARDPVQEDLLALTQKSPLPTPSQKTSSRASAEADTCATRHILNTHTDSSDFAVEDDSGSPSPIIIADPSTLIVEMSAVIPDTLHGSQDDAPLLTPARKVARGDPVLIGASETSVLRMLEIDSKNISGSNLSSDKNSADGESDPARTTDSSIPLCGQPQELIWGTPSPLPTPAVASTFEDPWEGVRRCLNSQEAEARSYFLSPSTNRFEPYAARGFFK